MSRQRGNDGTRKLRAERLARYAKQIDTAMVEGRPTDAPELRVTVGYEDEEQAHAQTTVPPPPEAPRGEAGALDAVPVLLVAREEIGWHSLDRDAELLLEAIDGQSSTRKILRASKIPSARALLLLVELEASGIIRLH